MFKHSVVDLSGCADQLPAVSFQYHSENSCKQTLHNYIIISDFHVVIMKIMSSGMIICSLVDHYHFRKTCSSILKVHPKDKGDMFIQNVDQQRADYLLSHPEVNYNFWKLGEVK
jgi:hypothetical protein